MLFKPSKQKKAQSAMEYLMTYGWAILIIAVVLGALFSLGVFSGSNLLGSACVAQSGYLCQNPIYYHGTVASGSSAGNILVTLGQNTGQTWSTANFIFVPEGTQSNAGVPSLSFVQTPTGVGNYLVSGVVSGQTVQVLLPVSGLASNTVSVGAAATGTIWALYQTSATAPFQYVQVATINIKAS